MTKKILVAVTGSTPQILTETIYALYKERHWVPNEVHVLTTTHGEQQITEQLFYGKKFEELCKEYQLSNIIFNQECIHVIKNSDGEKISDIKTVEQNDLAANMIVHFIHDLCQESINEIHVSLAGGRKSMGFYIGYALSLFGRQQDTMSHVLVDEKYEFSKEFFFPKKNNLEEQNAIWLADIPFVRMGLGMPKMQLDDSWSYGQAVLLTQTEISDFKIEIDLNNYQLKCSDFTKIVLTPVEIALYAAVAEASKKGFVVTMHTDINEIKSCPLEKFIELFLNFYKGREYEWSTEKLLNEDSGKVEIIRMLNESSSRIDKKLVEQLGSYAVYFGIKSHGKRGGKYYDLSIKRDNITIIE